MQNYKSIVSLQPCAAWNVLPQVAKRAIAAMDFVLWMRRVKKGHNGPKIHLIADFKWAMQGHFKNCIPTSVIYRGQKWSVA